MFNNRVGISAYNELLDYLSNARLELAHSSKEEQLMIINNIYLKCKELSLPIFECGKKSYYFNHILDILYYCEQYFESTYIINNKEKYDANYGDIMLDSPQNILDYIVYKVRHRIIMEDIRKSNILFPYENLDEVDLTDCCYDVSNWINEECKNLFLRSYIIRIDPGFNRKRALYQYTGFHYFCIVEVDNKKYIMDLTYKQFFKQNKNNLNRLGVAGLAGCLPGTYMMIDKDRRLLAERLIEDGFVEYNEKNLKNYLDGFALSVRNGTYYELLGSVDYTTNYSYNDYINFLNSKDDMFKHEPREGLGIQLKPLKNPYIDFEIKK